jgi:Cd2+/Zn2+-exporting ATPase
VQPLVMLTGDNPGVGNGIGREVGVDQVLAGLMPEDKAAAIKQLQETYGAVAMVGDGVNDAPALAHSTVGVPMGGAGTAVALETADVALMGDDISLLPFAVGLSRQARHIIRQNVVVALAAIALLLVATVTGVLGIGLAVLIHEGTTLVVIANALRLLGYKGSLAT